MGVLNTCGGEISMMFEASIWLLLNLHKAFDLFCNPKVCNILSKLLKTFSANCLKTTKNKFSTESKSDKQAT